MRYTLIILILFSFVGSLFSYSIWEGQIGNMIMQHDTRSVSMAGTGVAGSTNLLGLSANPANPVLMKKGFAFQYSFGLMHDIEKRSLPMYNFFSSYIDDATYASNSNLFDEHAAAMGYNFGLSDAMKMSIVASFRPMVSFDCNYDEQVRGDSSSDNNSYPALFANNRIEGKGKIDAAGLTAGITIPLGFTNLALGATYDYYWGSNTNEKRVNWTERAISNTGLGVLQDTLYKTHADYKGNGVSFGLNSTIGERLQIGAMYKTKVSLDTEADFTNQYGTSITHADIQNVDDYIIPSDLRVGFAFYPQNISKTSFYFDANTIFWSDVDSKLDDVTNYAIGIEHIIGRAVPMRFGFRYDSSPLDKEISLPVFTAGTGFPIATNLTMDLALEYSTRSYEALDLFHDGFYNHTGLFQYIKPTDRGWDNPDTVDESFTKIQASLQYQW